MFDIFLNTGVSQALSGKVHYLYVFGSLNSNMFYLIFGIILLVFAAWLFYTKIYRYGLLKKACTIPVQARVFAVDSKFGGRGGRLYNYTYEYFFNEKRYLINRDIWERSRLYRPQEGEIVIININPGLPEEYYDGLLDHARKNGIFLVSVIAICAVMLFVMPFFVK